MPELPEVETTLRGIAPFLAGKTLFQLIVRDRRLRWPVQAGMEKRVAGKRITHLQRRGKYILIHFDTGGLIIHLGMSGSMRVLLENCPPEKHDHFDMITSENRVLRYRDPRRFGSLFFSDGNLEQHVRLQGLGVEPLTEEFDGTMLYRLSKSRKCAVKTFIMDSKVVVGVGNIYAAESLFEAGINPMRRCDQISLTRYQNLSATIKQILKISIAQGGTTLKDFLGADGKPGYFEQKLMIYGRENLPCFRCGHGIKRSVLGQRSTFYCQVCQK